MIDGKYLIGLTGISGSGKSSVAEQLGRYGATVIDADKIARELARPGHSVYKLTLHFAGQDCLKADGTLDRAKVASRVFNNPELKKEFDRAIHPLVWANMASEIVGAKPGIVVLDVPLLVQTDMHT